MAARVSAVCDRVEDYDYAFEAEAIAQQPAERRELARLLLVERAGGGLADALVTDFPELLRAGDLLVLNETRVLPAKLLARRRSGGRVSVLVLAPRAEGATVLLGARGTLTEGEELNVAGDTWRIARALGEGRFEIEVMSGRDVATLMSDVGRMPLPPYIRRDPEADARDALDRDRYQTIFAAGVEANASGAIAAPTAGLHFTSELLARIETRGVAVQRLRLDVGEATFRPLRGETLEEHVMPTEHYAVPEALAKSFAQTRAAGGRVIAVGTTVVRSLESAVAEDGRTLTAGAADTDLFIRPGHSFRAVDALLTNFHQPRTSLLVLVSAFAGRRRILAAYTHALAAGYRLFSYGDATFIQ